MKGFLKTIISVLIIIISLIIGAKLFPEPSWGGVIFYTIFFLGLIGAAGYWILNLK